MHTLSIQYLLLLSKRYKKLTQTSIQLMFGGIIALLWGCTTLTIHTQPPSQTQDGLYTRQVILNQPDSNTTISCYVEINSQKIHGVSCQNDLGVILFSAGTQTNTTTNGKGKEGNDFIFSTNRLLLSASDAQRIVDMLSIDVFKKYSLIDGYTVYKSNSKTIIRKNGQTIATVVH